MRVTKPWLAFVLSFCVPGAGLAYIGRWRHGLLNLVGVTAIIIATLTLWGDSSALTDHFHYIPLILAAASAGYAHAMALQESSRVTSHHEDSRD